MSMHFENSDVVHMTPKKAYKTVRDELRELAPYIGNVQKIERVEYTKKSRNLINIVNHWYGYADIPSILKPIAKPEYLQWEDVSEWLDDKLRANFRMKSFHGKNLFDLVGSMWFMPEGKKETRLKIAVELDIHYENLPGVPRLLAGRIEKYIKDIVTAKATPNINRLAWALNTYTQKK